MIVKAVDKDSYKKVRHLLAALAEEKLKEVHQLFESISGSNGASAAEAAAVLPEPAAETATTLPEPAAETAAVLPEFAAEAPTVLPKPVAGTAAVPPNLPALEEPDNRSWVSSAVAALTKQ